MFLQPGRLLYVGGTGETDAHAHHAFQLMVSFDEPLDLAGAGARHVVSAVSLIPTDALHAIRRPASPVAILYLEPDGPDGRRLRSLGVNGASPEAWARAAERLKPFSHERPPETWAKAIAFSTRMLAAILGPAGDLATQHPALRRALDHAARHLERRIGIGELAAAGGVSASYLSRLFARDVGIPVRPYLRWLRLQRAAEAMATGRSLTEAAHEAGLSDSAHLTHAFRRMFGVAPSTVTKAALWVAGATADQGTFVQAGRRARR